MPWNLPLIAGVEVSIHTRPVPRLACQPCRTTIGKRWVMSTPEHETSDTDMQEHGDEQTTSRQSASGNLPDRAEVVSMHGPFCGLVCGILCGVGLITAPHEIRMSALLGYPLISPLLLIIPFFRNSFLNGFVLAWIVTSIPVTGFLVAGKDGVLMDDPSIVAPFWMLVVSIIFAIKWNVIRLFWTKRQPSSGMPPGANDHAGKVSEHAVTCAVLCGLALIIISWELRARGVILPLWYLTALFLVPSFRSEWLNGISLAWWAALIVVPFFVEHGFLAAAFVFTLSWFAFSGVIYGLHRARVSLVAKFGAVT